MTTEEKPQKVKCALPSCTLLVNPPKEANMPPLCHEHGEMFRVFMWAIKGVKFSRQPAPVQKIAVPRLVSPQGLPFRGL